MLALLNGTMSWEQSWATSDLSTTICENKVPKRQSGCLGLYQLGLGSHLFGRTCGVKNFSQPLEALERVSQAC